MRQKFNAKLEDSRLIIGYYASEHGEHFGAFEIIAPPTGQRLAIIASDGVDPMAEGWEHVSVSLKNRAPNWLEMAYVRDLFWTEDECVLQFHPPRAEYINFHPNCLHLWKPPYPVVLPPWFLVGPKTRGKSVDKPKS